MAKPLEERCEQARDARTAPKVLARFAAGKNASVRAAVAENPAALAALSRDAEAGMRLAVAENPEAPPEALERLAEDPAPEIPAALAARHLHLALAGRGGADLRRRARRPAPPALAGPRYPDQLPDADRVGGGCPPRSTPRIPRRLRPSSRGLLDREEPRHAPGLHLRAASACPYG
jgi:hypothetical protein